MANATANVQLNVTGNAQQQLAKTQKSVQQLQDSFGRLRNVVTGLAIGALVTNMFRAADAITDLSDATGIAVSDLLALRQAFALSGGDADTADKAILKLYQSIDEAAGGNDDLIRSFEKVGVSLQDIGTLSEQEIVEKTLKGLAAMGASAETVALKMKLLTKEGRNVDISAALQQYEKLKEVTKDAEPGIVAAGKIFDNLQKFKGDFATALAQQFSGLLGTLENLTRDTKSVAESLAQLTKIVVLATGAWLIFAKVIPAITTTLNILEGVLSGNLLSAISRSIAGIKNSANAIKNMSGKITDAAIAAGAAVTSFTKFKQVIFSVIAIAGNVLRILLRFTGIAGVIITVAMAFDFLFDKVLKLGSPLKWLGEKFSYVFEKAKEFFGFLISGDTNYFKETAEGAEQTAGALEEVTSNAAQTRDRLKEIREENQRFLESVRDVTKAYRERNAEVLQGFANEVKYLNLTDEQIALDKNRIELHKEFMDTLEELGKKRQEAMADPSKGTAVASQIDAEIKKVQESAVVTQTESAKKIKAYYAELAALKDITNAIEDTQRAFSQSEALQGLQDELSLVGLYGEELEKRKVILEAEKALREEMQRLSISLLELEAQRTRLGEEAYQKERARVVQQMNDTQALSEAKIKAYEEEQAKKQAIDQNYAEGAVRAMKDIAEQFKPINMAQEAVKKGWDSIGNAVDQFVETGKFKFGDFARSVLADLAKMIAKALIFKAINAALGGLGIPIPGLANGGPAKGGKPYIVGERGPELFVPQGNGTVVPNNKLGKDGVASGAVSAPITNNYITNNINAVDAQSVAQLFATNRKTLLGSVRLAEKELPYAG